MRERAIDAIMRGAADALTRRSAIRTLGAAALMAGLTGSTAAEAKKNLARKVKKRNKQQCVQARDGCRNIALGVPNPDEFSQIVLACCENCFVGDFLACLTAALSS
jgi:hypothetical protein